MWYITHALAGCLIGDYFDSLTIVVIVSLISHFLLDMLPHWDGPFDKSFFEKTGKIKMHYSLIFIEAADFLITLFMISYFIAKSIFLSKTLILVGAAVSLSPDLIKVLYFTPIKRTRLFMRYLKFHSRLQNEVSWKIGVFTQLLALIALLGIFHFI